jgi:hypothetical protein
VTFRIFFALLLFLPLPAQGQPLKHAFATRVAAGALRLDGRLDEDVWRGAEPIADFTQKEPTEGAAPRDRMEIRFAYDDSALYVGARMYTREAPEVQAPLGRRDNAGQAEHIIVSLDTFLDRRTAVSFGVTASGVRIDRFHSSDNESSFDSGFDPVWEARTARDKESWTAELWIPFSQLRFTPQHDHVWGINVLRFRPTLNEESYWIVVPRTERAWSSRFGELRGISDLRPTRRIELLPYSGRKLATQRQRRPGQPVRPRRQPREPGGWGRQDGPRTQSDARGDVQSRLRSGRSGSGRGQSLGLRDAFS